MYPIIKYRIAGKFGGDNVWRKWMDKDFGEKKFGELVSTDGTARDICV